MDTLADLYASAAEVWIQQDLIKDTIYMYAQQRDAAARRLMRRFKDLEAFPAMKMIARNMVPFSDVQYTRDFVVAPTFSNIDARDFARMVTNYTPCTVCQGTDTPYHRTIDCPRYRCPRCNHRQPGHTESTCAANEPEAPTLPPDIRSLTNLMKGGIFTQPIPLMWLLSVNNLYAGCYSQIARRPIEMLPPLFKAKRIELENAHTWYVVSNSRIDGAYASNAKVSALAMHMDGALIRLRADGIPFIDETELYGGRPPVNECHENTGERPPTPHPRRPFGAIPQSPESTHLGLSDTGNDTNENDENTPLHQYFGDSPTH
ncbi:uncharacterized protein B0H18DRAFT_958598 [Fomitopsis serialis]|uniref:uncharacterized protein n=1 Tax=Fomitopsis serialis TaxID=139415 RepID=UPI002007D99E|nr:uncharacterized protein B0H18DRAFT_958598 [Neoantrodia serialis]KAH9916929.1 hypothetical protein B0H18DRAFT_958598 [Neoantrodia serialis]